MDQSIQLGFLIGVYFMASAVVALTLLYFSRPRPKNQVAKNETRLENINASKTQNQAIPFEKGTLSRIKRIFRRKGVHKQSQQLHSGKELAAKLSDLSKIIALDQQQPPNKTINNPNAAVNSKTTPSKKMATFPESDSSPKESLVQGTQGEKKDATAIRPTNSTAGRGGPDPPESLDQENAGINENMTANKPNNISIDQAVPNSPVFSVQEKPQKRAKPAPVDLPNLPVIQGGPALPELATQKNQTPAEAKKIQPSIEMEPGNASNLATPSLKVVNEKGGKIEMEEKPKPAKATDDFSELFTEDNDEENEVGRLAKGLNELDTQDILDETRNLLSQFKKKC